MDLARQRLAAQRISATTFTSARQVVSALVAVQAQDYLGALWAVGLRTRDAHEADVERALANREIVRSWPMRGTLHFVAASDARWLVEHLAPRALAGAAGRLRQLGIDRELLARARNALVRALEGGKQLTRPAAYELLERAKIRTGERGLHILWALAHEGLLCFGPRVGKQQTFVLLDEWLPAAKRVPRDEALAELARRYFASRGPATLADFSWWSGLTLREARAASEGIDIESCHVALPRRPRARAYLLPAFDELLVGYGDRSAYGDVRHMLKPTVVIDDRIAGTWQRRLVRGDIAFELALATKLPPPQAAALELAKARYAKFLVS